MTALPCILEKTSHVLTAKGRFQRMDRLKTGERIINAYGKARRVRHIGMLPQNVREQNEIDLIGLELQGNPYRLRVPNRAFIPVKDNKSAAWCAVQDIDTKEGSTFSVALPDSFEFDLPRTMTTWAGGANYHVGFLLGTFMVCGIIVDEYANKSEYVCDSQELPRILASFGALGHTEENGMLEVRRSAFNSQVISRSPVLHDMNKKLFDNGRMLPQEWLSLDRDFLRGMYRGIARGHLLFVDHQTYHQLMFIQLVLENRLSRCERILSARSEEEENDPKYIAFVTDDTTTSAICEGVPVTCLPKS